MSVNKLVKKANKRIGKVHPVVKKGAKKVIKQAYKQGIYVLFSDGYRSNAEQNALYAQGRTTPGSIVTNARAGQSMHNYGLAIDMFITNKQGTTASWPYDKLKQVAQIAKDVGFEWGGDWASFKDNPHLQMTGGLSLSQLQAGAKPKLSLKKASKPKKKKKPAKTKKATGKIADIQTWLNNYGNYKLAVDNIAGAATKRALLRAYQNELNKQFKAGLSVDGLWGIKTRNASVTVRKGAKGNLTKLLQMALVIAGYKIDVDGIFGQATYKVVRSFQRRNGLAVDGVPGKATFAKLFS